MYVSPHFYMKEFPLSDYKKVLRQYAEVNEAIPRLWSVNLIYGMKDFLRRNWCFFFPLRHLHASSKWVSYSSKWICGIYTEIECMFVLSKALTSPVVHLSSWKWELCQEYSPFFWFCTRQWKCNNRYLADGALYVHLWHWISLRSEQRACRKELWVTDYFFY